MNGRVTFVFLAAAIGGCVGGDVDPDDPETGEIDQAIINGDPVDPENSGYAILSNGCSSTLLDNRWVLTAAHCVDSWVDRDFDSDGRVVTTFSGATAQFAEAVATDPAGRAVVVGEVDGKFALARYLPDGTLDPTFDGDSGTGNGRIVTDLTAATRESARAVAIDGLGRIVVGGTATTGNGDNFAVVRYLASGRLDTSFDGNGIRIVDFPTSTADRFESLAVDDQHRVVAVGSATVSGASQMALARLTASGAPDTTFDGNGLRIEDFTSITGESATDVVIDSLDRIVAAGPGAGQVAVARFRSDGSLDPLFDGDGKFLGRSSDASSARAYAVTVDSRDYVIVAGDSVVGGARRIMLGRLRTDGRPDTQFSLDGWQRISSSVSETAYDVAFDSQSRIVVGGWRDDDGGKFRLARVNGSGNPDLSFGNDGVIQTDFSSSSIELAKGIALTGDGRIVAAGRATVGGQLQFAVASYVADHGVVPGWTGLSVRMGSQTAGSEWVHRHPSLDVALIELATPLRMNGSTTGYEVDGFWTGALEVGEWLVCYGYGQSTPTGGAGTLRTALLQISSQSDRDYQLRANSQGQITSFGDSGSSCFNTSPTGQLLITGVNRSGDGTTTSNQDKASKFAAWVASIRG